MAKRGKLYSWERWITCCKHAEPSRVWEPGIQASWLAVTGGKRGRKRKRRILLKILAGVEERTMGRRSLGWEGVWVLGRKVSLERSHEGGKSATWNRTELKRSRRWTARSVCIRMVRSSYDIPSSPQDLPGLTVARASTISRWVIWSQCERGPILLRNSDTAKSGKGGGSVGVYLIL